METASTDDLINEVSEDIKKVDKRRESIRRDSLLRNNGLKDNKQSEEDDDGIINELAHVKNPENRTDTPEITKDEGPEREDKDKLYTEDGVLTAGEIDDGKIEMPEEMPVIEDAGTGRFVTDALDKQRQSERIAFQRLIDETTQAQNELTKTKTQLDEACSQRDKFYQEREEQKAKSEDLDKRLVDMQIELKKRMDIEDALARRGNETSDQFLERDQLETKLRDAQLKLKRLVKDMEEKDEKIEELSQINNSQEEVIKKLQQYVEPSVFQEIMSAHEKYQDNINDDYVSPGNVVRGNTNQKSAVCAIQ